MNPLDRPPKLDGPEMSDEQTRSQVVDPARRVVQAAGLGEFTAAFSYKSCTDQGVPPFRGVVNIAFVFPPGVDEKAEVERIAAVMIADGWSDGPPPGRMPHGRVVHQGDMMAILGTNANHPGEGDIDIFGECRNATDHRNDEGDPYEDIAAELRS